MKLINIVIAIVAIVVLTLGVVSSVHGQERETAAATVITFTTPQTAATLPPFMQAWVGDDAHQMTTCSGEASDVCWKLFTTASERDAALGELDIVISIADGSAVTGTAHTLYLPIVAR